VTQPILGLPNWRATQYSGPETTTVTGMATSGGLADKAKSPFYNER
jgi:hypothetical protein